MRLHRISRLVVVWALAAAAACSSKVAPEPTPAPSAPAAAAAGGARTITLEALEASLASLKLEEKDAGRFRDDRRFWTLINDSLDARFSIVFVTSRFPSEPASDRTSAAIRSVHPAVSYGDSDGDIADTHEADPAIRAVRIIRSPVSYNERPFQPGEYGEEILANSAD
jgi:hypothetical protein